ncbi:indolepyruvate oxidoreductase subunit beta family protein [Reyranella sp. MMS21-HV4-11]|uniref:Indolepyruvate oxidoreductase subunit beta family protein n=1 Tax=Reyranella humidisoli TaxID=2849149 RepID=A0ABS6IKK6_9HYPH|nr:indolepyruvate oxidoreductase subunit beta family protein [Reyranella sp. MMS21-HV4-11]MBU8875129.1 indolepyruvate oxidoreductase subunit beta family protein [Reyranella sp. MMS21-HV4-11]
MKPLTILIGALGGDGGGVLCDWIVAAAQSQGLGVQATQIPGVAQRTGATTYYLEVMPAGARISATSVLALNPAMGEVDVALATELLEAGRMIFNGFVTPDRTTLIASTHRVLAIGERMAMGDGSFDVGRLLRAVKERSRAQILFDMDQAAEESGGVINAVLLGALAGSGKLPIPDGAFEAAIRHSGKSIDTNLAAFAFGRGHARGELEQAVREHRKRQTAVQGAEDLIERARRTLPVASLDIVEEGIRRLTSYQDRRYATLYLDRLDTIHALGSGELLREVARHLAVRMSFEDVIRVAQAKTSAERMMRVRAEVRAKDHEPLAITEHFKPGIEEIAAVLPPSIAKRLLGWGERTGRLGKTYFSMQVRTTTILGFARLRLVAGLRWWRPRTSRYVAEQTEIERWLGQIRAASPLGIDLAREIAESARLIKGYGDTHKRGLGNYRRIADEVIAPALAGRLTPRAAADAVANARVAALADPEGESLSRTLTAIAGATSPLKQAAE